MKISANKLVYDFARKSSATRGASSNSHQIIEIINYLNEALEIWFSNRVRLRETDDSVRNALRPFEVKANKVIVENVDNNVSRFKYPYNFYAKTSLYIVCTKGCCEGIEKDIEPMIVQSDDLLSARRDTYQKSSFEWERLLADEAGDYMYLYHDGECTSEKGYLSYIRVPERIEAPDLCENPYEDYDGKLITKNVDLEVDNTFDSNRIVDIAILCASRDTTSTAEFQLQINKITTTTNL